MFNGVGSSVSIAERIAADFEKKRKLGRYTLPQAFELVIERQMSLFSPHVSYVWWSIEHRGEPEIVAEMGKVDLTNHNVVYTELRENGNWSLVDGLNSDTYEPDLSKIMLMLGLSYGQKVLSRCSGEWYKTSWEYEEYDLDFRTKIIFAEPVNAIDIPFIIENPFSNRARKVKVSFV